LDESTLDVLNEYAGLMNELNIPISGRTGMSDEMDQ
jgi:hypothetical protein